MSIDIYYRGDDIRLPYQFQNADGTVMDLTEIIIKTELRKEKTVLSYFKNKPVDVRIVRNNNGSDFEIFIPKEFTSILPANNNYELLVKLDDKTPHLTTWDNYPFKLL